MTVIILNMPKPRTANDRQFQVFGKDRRAMKKDLSQVKSIRKNFWRSHQMDKDMAAIYGSTHLVSDAAALERFSQVGEEIKALTRKLAIPYA